MTELKKMPVFNMRLVSSIIIIYRLMAKDCWSLRTSENYMLRLKKIIIKRAMKLFEREPTSKDIIAWSEIFCHDSFTKGTKEERERIMFESSEYRYCYENQHPWTHISE